jgi:hypothetical protein
MGGKSVKIFLFRKAGVCEKSLVGMPLSPVDAVARGV